MLSINKRVKSILLVVGLFVGAQTQASFQLSKKSEIAASVGLGVLAGAAKFTHDRIKYNTPLSKKSIGAALGVGAMVALFAHLFLVTTTPEWRAQNELHELEKVCDNAEQHIEYAKKLMGDIENVLPSQHENIVDYAQRVYKKPWALCAAFKAYESFGKNLQGSLEALEEQKKLVKMVVDQKLPTATCNVQAVASALDAAIKEIPVVISKLNGLNSSVNHITQKFIGHAQYQSHYALYKEQELEEKIKEYDAVKAKNSDLIGLVGQQAKKIDELASTITKLRETIKELKRSLAQATPATHAASTEQAICTICFSSIDSGPGQLTTQCNHTFHVDCFMEHIKSSHDGGKCPVCRREKPLGCSLTVQGQTGYNYH